MSQGSRDGFETMGRCRLGDLFGFSIVNIVKKLLGKNVTDKGGSSSNPLDQLDTAAASRLSVSVCMMADVDGDGKDDDADDDSASLSI